MNIVLWKKVSIDDIIRYLTHANKFKNETKENNMKQKKKAVWKKGFLVRHNTYTLILTLILSSSHSYAYHFFSTNPDLNLTPSLKS